VEVEAVLVGVDMMRIEPQMVTLEAARRERGLIVMKRKRFDQHRHGL